ncbi:hypothetical protein E2C06_13320 [Dankookia rubra]|uniref:DUF4280 domain-containing protein n=1 Tax=Dankookia rubra TaxID=1442381 RepID=A0A4R5QHW1_9PROT|nr:hypothetical protein [Dankookia rubra]TDH62147.1 hypothetical protein E2C06_13320 [Dankookia rubra]
MPGPLLHLGATVLCGHAGQATPAAPNPRVRLSGQPVVTALSPYLIAGCPLPPVAGGPCVSGLFTVAATRVFASGAPVLLLSGTGTCVPTGVPLVPVAAQPRVRGL